MKLFKSQFHKHPTFGKILIGVGASALILFVVYDHFLAKRMVELKSRETIQEARVWWAFIKEILEWLLPWAKELGAVIAVWWGISVARKKK